MTTTTDLSRERLDELEDILGTADDLGIIYIGDGWHPITLVGELRALIATARAKKAAVRERDALRALLEEAYSDREAVRDPDESCYWCDGVPPRDYEMNPANLSHTEDCLGEKLRAALAQPTTEGGE